MAVALSEISTERPRLSEPSAGCGVSIVPAHCGPTVPVGGGDGGAGLQHLRTTAL